MSKIKNWALTKVAAHYDEEGQGLAEYGLILALIAVICIAGLTVLGGDINALLTKLGGSIK